jgi:hypothetical protein
MVSNAIYLLVQSSLVTIRCPLAIRSPRSHLVYYLLFTLAWKSSELHAISGVWQASKGEVGTAVKVRSLLVSLTLTETTFTIDCVECRLQAHWWRLDLWCTYHAPEYVTSSHLRDVIKNEEEVGKALKECSVPRDQIWITSKVGPGQIYLCSGC